MPRRRRAASSSDDELVRGELSGDELRDELDEFESGECVGAVPAAQQQQKHVLAFSDSESDRHDPSDDHQHAIPSDRAWGSRKSAYYDTEYVDENWRGASKQRTLELADMEEQEARAIQSRMAELLQQDDLQFNITEPTTAAVEQPYSSVCEQRIELDVSGLTSSERLKLLQKESPELLPLISELISSWSQLVHAQKIHQLMDDGYVGDEMVVRYLNSRRRLLSDYCLNICFYLSVRATVRTTASHPVLKRIAQYGKLLRALQSTQQLLQLDIDRVLKLVSDGKTLLKFNPADVSVNRKRLSLTPADDVEHQLEQLSMHIDVMEAERRRLTAVQKDDSKPGFTELRQAGQTKHHPLDPFRKRKPTTTYKDPSEADAGPSDDVVKRGITVQIAKNKGLMPKRSLENRNPRVKHKNKFQRAIKKRRTMVRLPRKEVQKYDGERFGIRMGTVKSISIK